MIPRGDFMNVKKTLIFTLKVIFFTAALVPFVYKLGIKYSAASTENKINNYNESRWNDFYALPENSLDVVFLGSSHSYCTFDPEIFDSRLGTSSFQLGMPLQHMDTTYYTLKEVLNYQKPECVVLEVYWDMLDDEFELTQAGYLFQVMRNEELENEYISDVFPLSEKIKYSVPSFRYQADYFAFKTADWKTRIENKYDVSMPAAAKQEGTEQYRSKGYTYCDYHMLPDEFDKTNQFKGLDGSKWKINKTQQKYLIKLTDLCKENEINILWVTAPIANVSMDFIKDYDGIHNTIQKLADENNILYTDYNIINREKNMLTNDNFRDDAHLNHTGVEIVDADFAEILANYINKTDDDKKMTK